MVFDITFRSQYNIYVTFFTVQWLSKQIVIKYHIIQLKS